MTEETSQKNSATSVESSQTDSIDSSSATSRYARVNLVLFFLIAVLGVTADLVSKHQVFQALGMPREYRYHEEPELMGVYWLWHDVVGFQTSLNQGALFGMGQGKIAFLIPLAGLALIGIGIWVFHSAKKSRFLSVVLGMIVAGILGNLYDRLGMHQLIWNYADDLHRVGDSVYAVRDWILVMLGSYPWPNFNIADSLLVCGAILMVLHSFLQGDDTTPKKPATR